MFLPKEFIIPGKDSLATLFSQQYSCDHVMYLEHCTQQPQAKNEQLKVFGVDELGNDTFATNKLNSAVHQMSLFARNNYNLSSELAVSHAIAAHSGNNIKYATIKRTGPSLMHQVLIKEMKCEKNKDGAMYNYEDESKKKGEIHRFRDSKVELAIPNENTAYWLNTKVREYEDSEKAINQVIQTIEFEAKHFKLLRLDDHISDLTIACNMRATEAWKKLQEKDLKKIIKKNIVYTQLTGEFKETINYVLRECSLLNHEDNVCQTYQKELKNKFKITALMIVTLICLILDYLMMIFLSCRSYYNEVNL